MNPFEGRAPQHIGYVVEDVDRVHALLGSTLGLRVSTPREAPIAVDIGEPTTLKTFLAQVGDAMLEFIQPEGGYWLETLRERGPGVHHVSYAGFGDEFDATLAGFESQGFKVPVAGHFGETVKWAYVESDGLVLELSSGRGPSFEPPARP